MTDALLTPAQKRSIRASLLSFEQALRKADRMLSEEDEIGILYSRRSRLNIQQRRAIQAKIARALEDLADLTRKLGLEPAEDRLEGVIMADMAVSWETLEGCRSTRMRGYGEMNPDAVEIIDPAIDHLAGAALELYGLVTSDSEGAPEGAASDIESVRESPKNSSFPPDQPSAE